MHHTLCALQDIHKSHDKFTCGMHNPLKKIISTEGQHKQETRLQSNIIGESKSYFLHEDGFLWILFQGIHRHNKHIEEKNHPQYLLKGV